MKENHRNPVVENRIQDSLNGQRNSTDTDMLTECSICEKKFKKRGLKIHQAKNKSCAEQLSGLQRIKSKSEVTSTRDTNHSDASGRVSLSTTHRGNGVQNMDAMDKVKQKIRKNTGETCREKGGNIAKVEGKKARVRNEDIRYWMKKDEFQEKETIHQGKGKKEQKSCENEGGEEIVINLEDDISQAENKEIATSSEYAEMEKLADILRGPSNEMLNQRLQLRRYDFATLSGAEYLNDMIIKKYIISK